MSFQFHTTLTEEDYLAFNCFHSLDSKQGQKQIIKSRVLFALIVGVLSLVVSALHGFDTISIVYLLFAGIATIVYISRFKHTVRQNLRKQMTNLKNAGKLPFDEVSQYTFTEDRFVEISATKRLEQDYSILERICVLENRYLILYVSSITACILPITQLKSQIDVDAFLTFLSQKCPMVEHYR